MDVQNNRVDTFFASLISCKVVVLESLVYQEQIVM